MIAIEAQANTQEFPTQHFAQAIQHKIIEDTPRTSEVEAGILAQHNVSEADVLPAAAPDQHALNRLTDDDWAAVNTSPAPFVTLYSKANRRSIEERVADRNETSLDALGIAPTREQTSREAMEAAGADAFLRSLPVLHGGSMASMDKAVDSGAFLSNQAVIDTQGPDYVVDDWFDTVGNTLDEDRETRLDGFFFGDFGRPSLERMGEGQPQVIAVLTPDVLETPGTFITQKDYADYPVETGKEQPRAYMAGASEPEDFYATFPAVLARIPSKHKKVGEDSNMPLTVDMYARGENGNYTQDGQPLFSACEAKIPGEASIDMVNRFIFRDPADRDAFVAKHGDRFHCIVVPDVKAALANGEDIFGTRERQQAKMAEYTHKDYQARQAALAASQEPRTVEYQLVGPGDTVEVNPDWSEAGFYANPDDVVRRKQAADALANTFGSLFSDEVDGGESAFQQAPTPEPVRIAKIVRSGNTRVIESIGIY